MSLTDVAPDTEPVTKGDAKEDILTLAKRKYQRVSESAQEVDNRACWLESTKFAFTPEGDEQWPQYAREVRKNRPMLTLNKVQPFLNQVMNDARQNRPSIKVLPVDDNADPQTAQVYSDLIRNIEATSSADIAYDTAVEHAIGGGFGFIKIALDYTDDDAFDLDILIQRVPDPLAIYGDPDSLSADGSDWNCAFETQWLSKEKFEEAYGDKAKADWDTGYEADWRDETDGVLVLNYWTRTKVELPGFLMPDGTFLSAEDAEAMALELAEGGIDPMQPGRPVSRRTWKVEQYIMTGAEVLEGPILFPGKYIPIVPVYGKEALISGRRYLRSLIYSAMDAQRLYNYQRSAGAELLALAPKAPWKAHEDAIDADQIPVWANANTNNESILFWKGSVPPERQLLDSGPALGAMQEAQAASDDIKSTIGMFDASLGQRSNETSGVAIQARQREGDTATFHFQDNQTRAIRQVGRIVVGLIPHVYTEGRILRVLGEDGTPKNQKVGGEMPVTDPESGEPVMQEEVDPMTGASRMVPMMQILDLAAGKYDVSVAAGPSYTTRRQEASAQMASLMQSAPEIMQHVVDMYVKGQDWPNADAMAQRLKERLGLGDPPPEVQKMQGQMEEMNGQMEQAGQQMQQLQAENEALKQKAEFESQQLQMKAQGEADKLAFEREKLALARDELALERQKMLFDVEQQRAEMLKEVQIARIKAMPPAIMAPPMTGQPAPRPF